MQVEALEYSSKEDVYSPVLLWHGQYWSSVRIIKSFLRDT